MPKLSRFSVVTQLSDTRIAVMNTWKRGLVTLPLELLNKINKGAHELPGEVITYLETIGILTESRDRELDEFLRHYETIQHSGHVSLWLYLSTDCNLGCPYCYQGLDKPRYHMTNRTIDGVVNLIKQCQDGWSERSLNVIFYGGEPLLNKRGLMYAMQQFNSEFRDMPKTFNMITNGTLCDGESDFKAWATLGLTGIQITLDGPKEVHDTRRVTIDENQGTWDKVIETIKNASRYLKSVSIRINYDLENFSSIYSLIDQLKDMGLNRLSNLSLSFHPIFASKRIDYKKSRLLNGEQHIETLCLLNAYGRSAGFSVTLEISEGPCTIRSFSGLVVYSNGDVYSCPGFAGMHEYKWGNVHSGIDWKKQHRIVHEGIYPECKTCPVLPICAGGCEFHELANTGTSGRHCERSLIIKKVRYHSREVVLGKTEKHNGSLDGLSEMKL